MYPTDPIGQRIVSTFDTGDYKWQTLRDIVQASGLLKSQVQQYIELHPDYFRVAPIAPAGIKIYSLEPVGAAAK